MNRRTLLAGVLGAAVAVGGGSWVARRRAQAALHWMPPGVPGTMRLRAFGKTGIKVSEVGFGSWGIGGKAYGAADKTQSLAALARAEELGCNFVDSAAVIKNLDLVISSDTTLVHLAGRESLVTVFTVDHDDFETYRIAGRRRFRIVPERNS